jgi:hypothetical protein
MHSVYIVGLHVHINCIKIQRVTYQDFYGKLLSPATIKLASSSCKVPDTALKKMIFICSWLVLH